MMKKKRRGEKRMTIKSAFPGPKKVRFWESTAE